MEPTDVMEPETQTFNASPSSSHSNETEEATDPELVRFRFVVHAVVVPVLFAAITVVGLAGNSLVVYAVTTRRRLRTVTNLLLLNLAIADLCFVAVVPPFTAYEYVAGELPQSSWALGDAACRLLHYLVNVTAYVTVYTLTMIAAVRYATVVHGTRTARWRTRRNVIAALVGLWVVVMAVNVPILMSYSVSVDEETGLADCDIVDFATGRRVFATLFAFAYVLPLCAIAVLSALILVHIARAQRSSLLVKQASDRKARPAAGAASAEGSPVQRRGIVRRIHSLRQTLSFRHRLAEREKSTDSRSSRRAASEPETRKRQVTRLLVLVVVVFALLWLPIHIHLLLAFNYGLPSSRVYVALSVLWNCLAYFNSCVNPIIYNHTSKEFRDAFRSVVQLCCSCRPGERNDVGAGGGGANKEGNGDAAAVPLRSPSPPYRSAHRSQNLQKLISGSVVAAGASVGIDASAIATKVDNVREEDPEDDDALFEEVPLGPEALSVLGRLRPQVPLGDRIAVPVVIQLHDRVTLAADANSYFSV